MISTNKKKTIFLFSQCKYYFNPHNLLFFKMSVIMGNSPKESEIHFLLIYSNLKQHIIYHKQNWVNFESIPKKLFMLLHIINWSYKRMFFSYENKVELTLIFISQKQEWIGIPISILSIILSTVVRAGPHLWHHISG